MLQIHRDEKKKVENRGKKGEKKREGGKFYPLDGAHGPTTFDNATSPRRLFSNEICILRKKNTRNVRGSEQRLIVIKPRIF